MATDYPASHMELAALADKRPSSEVIIGAAVTLVIFGALVVWGFVR